MKEKVIGFFGLGNMGIPICQGMVKCGYKVILPCFRPARTPEREAAIKEMLEQGAAAGTSQLEMIKQCDIFMLSLPKSQQVEELVLAEDGILKNAKPGSAIIDMTSADAASTRNLAKLLEEKNIDILDCPVSGGVGGAAAQTLTIMVGGKKEVFDKYREILDTAGDPNKIFYIGPSGSGDMIKCANNFLSACCAAATAEAIAVCAKAGIDPRVSADIIGKSGGTNHAATTKFPNLLFKGKQFNFALNLMEKDIGLFNKAAKEMNVPAFFGNTTAQLWKIPMAEQGETADWINVPRLYEKWADVKMSGVDVEE